MVQLYRGVSALKRAGIDKQMWRARYDIFIEMRGWNLPHRDKQERDNYDTEDAHYLVSFTDDGRIKGSARLIPTTYNHLLSDVFSHLVSPHHSIPQGSAVVEMTRYFVHPENAQQYSLTAAAGEILCAMLEYAQDEGITTIVAVTDMWCLDQVLEMNWTVRPLGLPQPYGGGPDIPGGGTAIAVAISVTDEAITNTALMRKVSLPALQLPGERVPSQPQQYVH